MQNKGFSLILFFVGIFAAILFGILQTTTSMPAMPWLIWVLAIDGLLIGLLNISNSEAVPYMIAALVIGASTGIFSVLASAPALLEAIFSKIAVLTLVIAIPVALKTVYNKAK